jgi:PAS domain-containing protein
MSSATQKGTPTQEPVDNRALPLALVRARWLLVITFGYLIVFAGNGRLEIWPDYVFLGALLLSNVVVAFLGSRPEKWPQLLEFVTVADVLSVAMVIALVDPSVEMYLACFAGLIMGAALARVGLVSGLMALITISYAVYLYNDVGSALWRDHNILLRFPLVFVIGVYFSTVAGHLRVQKARSTRLEIEAKQTAQRAHKMEREHYRLRALSQIGQIGLTSAGKTPARVMLEMGKRMRDALALSRSAVALFSPEQEQIKVVAKSKDGSSEVIFEPPDPEGLNELLEEGKLTELHPESSRMMQRQLEKFVPVSAAFGSVLIAPIGKKGEDTGAFFLMDRNPNRSFSDGERDFCSTVSMMALSYLQERERIENEALLRSLLANAPVVVFALDREGDISVIAGKVLAALKIEPGEWVGRSVYDLSGKPELTRIDVEEVLEGKSFTGKLQIRSFVFEIQYSPLRDLDGNISGVIGVTTALLEQLSD